MDVFVRLVFDCLIDLLEFSRQVRFIKENNSSLLTVSGLFSHSTCNLPFIVLRSSNSSHLESLHLVRISVLS